MTSQKTCDGFVVAAHDKATTISLRSIIPKLDKYARSRLVMLYKPSDADVRAVWANQQVYRHTRTVTKWCKKMGYAVTHEDVDV